MKSLLQHSSGIVNLYETGKPSENHKLRINRAPCGIGPAIWRF